MDDTRIDENISKSTIDRIIKLFLSVLLIEDCRRMVVEGKRYHLISIYGQLRAILTDPTQEKKKGPLLLSLSKLLEIDLNFFYSPVLEEYINKFNLQDLELCHISLELSMDKMNSRHKEVSIEDFLVKDIFVFKEKKYNFEKIINNLSNKLGGSHYDPTIPKDIADLSNIHWGDIPVLDNYLLQFIDILVPVALKIPKIISDNEIWFAFTLFTYPVNEVVLLDISVPNRYSRILIVCQRDRCSIKTMDLLGNHMKIDFDANLELEKLTILSISHILKNTVESEITIYKNGDFLCRYNVPPLLLYNEYYWCEIFMNKSIDGNAQDFEFGIHQASYWNRIFTSEKRVQYIKSINECNSKPLHIPRNNYAYVDKESHKIKIVQME